MTLRHYMDLFDFAGLRLDLAFRYGVAALLLGRRADR